MTASVDSKCIALAHRMADRAGEIARRYFRQPVEVDRKSDASPVTIADREIEILLRQYIETQFPDHGIIGEEFGNVRKDSPYQWVLDPIDGTRAFIDGTPTFTTLIALAYRDVPILGVIDQPVSGERWLGVAGAATTLNGATTHVSGDTPLSQAILCATAMKYFRPDEAEAFNRVRAKCAGAAFGGDAYIFAGLASGRNDIVVEAGLKPYDFCALKTVVEGAGGIITDWQGKPLTIHSDGRILAAASGELHKEALALLVSA